MDILDKFSPTYNLNVVIRETGVKADTLRAWERRYGLPTPERTGGGHRLYSLHDIEVIRWLQARLDEGLRISSAVDLWRQYESQGSDPLVEAPIPGVEVNVPLDSSQEDALAQFREAWIASCRRFDETSAENALSQAFSRFPLETVCFEILQKGLVEIGKLWYQGDITVQQEHFSSALAIRRLNALMASQAPPTRAQTVLVACAPGEDHVFAPLLISLLLRRLGWTVVYLGANVPYEDLLKTVEAVNADLVILSSTTLSTSANLLYVTQNLMEHDVTTAYGGPIFNNHSSIRGRIPAYYLGETIPDVIDTASNLLTGEPAPVEYEPTPTPYLAALEEFLRKRTENEAHVVKNLQGVRVNLETLQMANDYLGHFIRTGLSFGDLDIVISEFEWLETLMSNKGTPPELLDAYLSVYHQALAEKLSEAGQPLVDWMGDYLSGR